MSARSPGPRTRRGRRSASAAIAALCILALVGSSCSGGGDSIARATSGDRTDSSTSLDWGSCGDAVATGTDLECATLAVPLDPANSDGDTIDLELARSPATGSDDERIGSLVFNPGGPGGSGIEFLSGAALVVPEELHDRFDLVSFDPRGVGESSPVVCVDDETKEEQLEEGPAPSEKAETAREIADQEAVRDGCESRNGDIIEHMSTADVAADLDQIREAVGDDTLSYVGFSYGTAIGATYATLFPDRVRAMVLDGAVSPTADDIEQSVVQAQGFERTYAEFVQECDTTEDCALAPDTATAIDTVRKELDRRPTEVDSESGTRKLTRDLLDYALLTAMYDSSLWGAVARAIDDLENGGAELLLNLVDQQIGRMPDGSWSNQSDANTMVTCADSTKRPSIDEALADGKQITDASPNFGDLLDGGPLTCVDWPLAANPVPDWTGDGAPTVLVVGTKGDPATPYEWAQQLTAALDDAVLLTYEGAGHTAFLRAGACIDDAVTAYLIDLTTPPEGTSCAVEADAPGAGDSFVDALVDQLEGMGVPVSVATCITDALIEEFGKDRLEQLLLSGDVVGMVDAVSRFTQECLAGG